MTKLPRGLRRNSQRTDWQGEVDESAKNDNSFEEFETIAYGYRALIKLLQNYRKVHGCQTISDFINRWAPETENNTSGYIKRVCTEMEVPSTFVPDVDDKDTMCAFAAAISQVENGVPAVIADVESGWQLL